MPVESSPRLHTSSPLRCLDIITITAHSTEVLHSCDAVMAVFHIVIIPESILKGPTWKTVEGWASPRRSQVVQGWNKSLACFIFIAACLLNSSFGHPLKGTGCAIDCSHSLRDYLCLYGTALIARRTTLFFMFFLYFYVQRAVLGTCDQIPWPTALRPIGAARAHGLFLR